MEGKKCERREASICHTRNKGRGLTVSASDGTATSAGVTEVKRGPRSQREGFSLATL